MSYGSRLNTAAIKDQIGQNTLSVVIAVRAAAPQMVTTQYFRQCGVNRACCGGASRTCEDLETTGKGLEVVIQIEQSFI